MTDYGSILSELSNQNPFSKFLHFTQYPKRGNHLVFLKSEPERFFNQCDIETIYRETGFTSYGSRYNDSNLKELRKRISETTPTRLALDGFPSEFSLKELNQYPLNQTTFWIFVNDMNDLIKYNDFDGQYQVIFPHETPNLNEYKTLIRAARDITAKYTVKNPPLGEIDCYRTTEFLCDYTVSHRKYNVPCKSLQKAYRQFMMSIGEYEPYFETKDFLSKHFIPDLEGVLSVNLNMDLTVSRLRINGNRTPHYFGLTLSPNGNMFLI